MEIDYDLLVEKIIEKKNKNNQPFTVICNRCGGHRVRITACEYMDLGMECQDCGHYENFGTYESK